MVRLSYLVFITTSWLTLFFSFGLVHNFLLTGRGVSAAGGWLSRICTWGHFAKEKGKWGDQAQGRQRGVCWKLLWLRCFDHAFLFRLPLVYSEIWLEGDEVVDVHVDAVAICDSDHLCTAANQLISSSALWLFTLLNISQALKLAIWPTSICGYVYDWNICMTPKTQMKWNTEYERTLLCFN